MRMVAALIVSSAAVLTALGVIWRRLRPIWRGVLAVHDIIERELTPNGGSSMKDAATAASKNAAEAKRAAFDASAQLREVAATQATILHVVDTINTVNHGDHEAIWGALASLGYERRET